jgi:hypothetical protein
MTPLTTPNQTGILEANEGHMPFKTKEKRA